jgi:hypothetical protein
MLITASHKKPAGFIDLKAAAGKFDLFYEKRLMICSFSTVLIQLFAI